MPGSFYFLPFCLGRRAGITHSKLDPRFWFFIIIKRFCVRISLFHSDQRFAPNPLSYLTRGYREHPVPPGTVTLLLSILTIGTDPNSL